MGTRNPRRALITETLKRFDCFHDWYIDIMATRNEADAKVPDTFILGLFDEERRATITFSRHHACRHREWRTVEYRVRH
jgi:hypothetical protein